MHNHLSLNRGEIWDFPITEHPPFIEMYGGKIYLEKSTDTCSKFLLRHYFNTGYVRQGAT